MKNILYAAFLLLTTFKTIAQLSPPGIEWQSITCPPFTFNGQGQTREQSGDDWWYSHKNLYNSGAHTGYVMVGYTNLVATAATYNAARTMYDEGSDSPYNPVLGGNYDFNTVGDCSDRDYVGERRAPFRGNLGICDLSGNMLWCKPRTSGDLVEVVQDPSDPNIVYVTGGHGGARPFRNPNAFLSYNKTSANPTDYFSNTQMGNAANYIDINRGHMYVAKIDISVPGGSVIWEGLYGNRSYGTTAADRKAAFEEHTTGFDLFIASNGELVVVGVAGNKPLLVRINPTNGYLLGKNTLIQSGYPNSTGLSNFGWATSAIEIGTTGYYAIACCYLFGNSGTGLQNPNDKNRALVWAVNSSLAPAYSYWGTNPIQFPGAGNPYFTSNTWEIKYHSGLQQLMLAVVRDCDECFSSGTNSGNGYIYRLNNNGSMASGTNPSPMGAINAFDLRIGVEEMSDGGFIAVSSKRPTSGYHTLPTNSELGYMSSCPPTQSDFANWDTDAHVVRFLANGATLWTKTFDVSAGRSRQTPPQDLKLQECMYKVTQAADGGFVISGNTSHNFDDNYMAKIYEECEMFYPFSYGVVPEFVITSNTTWNSSKSIKGKIRVASGAVLTITGNTTKIRFGDSKRLGIETCLIIDPGARVDVLNGAELTSLDYGCPGGMWDGIYVGGNSWKDQSIPLYDVLANWQGILNISNSTISNARNAINVFKKYSSVDIDWSTTGGIVMCNNSDFVNNRRDVQYLTYNFPNNKGEFNNCRFLTTGKLKNGEPPEGHISMYAVLGVKIRGCEFKYSAGANYSNNQHGYGIRSIDAVYNVEDYCSSPPNCSTVIRSKFENLNVGVWGVNTNPFRAVNVDNSIFTNNFYDGIALVAANTSRITRNTISTGTGYLFTSGINIANSHNFYIANNDITGNMFGAGIYVHNCGGGDNRIYKNSFKNLNGGIVPQYDNLGNTFPASGLRMNCNDFTNQTAINAYNVVMLGISNNWARPSVAEWQGVPNGNPISLVRNKYGNVCNGLKWSIEDQSLVPITQQTIQHASNSESYTQPN